MLNYFIFHTLSLFVFWAFYQVFLKRDTFFERNRWFLLLSLGVALLAPFLEIPLSKQSATEIVELQILVLPEITVGESQAAWEWFEIVQFIYFLGVAIALVLFGLRLGKLLLLIRPTPCPSPKERGNTPTLSSVASRYIIKLLPASSATGRVGTFSFFNYLFWDSSQNLTKEEEQQILEHELAHIKGGHSYDLIFIELQKIVFWFNPLIYLYEKELRNQHEFIADSKAKRISNTEDYISLMVSSLFKSLQINLTHSFHNQQIKQRIKMLHTTKTTKMKGNAKTILAVVLVAVIGFAVACTNALTGIEKDQKLSEMKIAQGQNEKALLAAYQEELVNILKRHPKAEIIEYSEDNVKITNIFDPKDGKRIAFLMEKIRDIKKANLSTIRKSESDEQGIFTVVEKSASPIGGIQEMFKFMENEMTYPQQAREKGIQGKVFVQFVVNEDGKLSDIRAVRGIGDGCDEEAMRVIALTKWEAGEQDGKKVKQRLVLPIVFKLD
jgi:TonB family protein